MTSQAWFEFSTAAGWFVTHIGINQLLLRSLWTKSSSFNIKLPSFAAMILFCDQGHAGNCRQGSKYNGIHRIFLYIYTLDYYWRIKTHTSTIIECET